MGEREALRALVVDDERVARLALVRRLEATTKDVAVCGEAANGKEAFALIDALNPDVVFLDVAMPGCNGFDVARRLAGEDAPLIVFLTAYGDRALEAFETDAIDYLMKPVAPERLARALERVRAEHAKRKQLKLTSELRSVVQRFDESRTLADPANILRLDVGDGIVCLQETKIHFVEAAGEYACVHTANETHVVRRSLKQFEGDLLSARFFRIHRQTIVNLDEVERCVARQPGENFVKLMNGKELAVSRRKLTGLRAALTQRV